MFHLFNRIVAVRSVYSNVAKIPDYPHQWNFDLYVSGFWHIHTPKTPRGIVAHEQQHQIK